MSERYTAFLRAINVGGRRVKKERLKEIVEGLGFEGVHTYLASGNIVFESPLDSHNLGHDGARSDLAGQLGGHLSASLGYSVPTFVRTVTELAEIARAPFLTAAEQVAGTKQYVVFMDDPLDDAQLQTLAALDSDVDQFEASGTEVLWTRHVDAGESLPTGDLERALDVRATRRNLNTIRRMVAKFS